MGSQAVKEEYPRNLVDQFLEVSLIVRSEAKRIRERRESKRVSGRISGLGSKLVQARRGGSSSSMRPTSNPEPQ